MKKEKYKIKAKVWVYPSEKAAWYFVSLEKRVAKEIKEKYGAQSRGFGSLPVRVELGESAWETSIFPDKRSETYLLPLKKKIREEEGIWEGDEVDFSITLI